MRLGCGPDGRAGYASSGRGTARGRAAAGSGSAPVRLGGMRAPALAALVAAAALLLLPACTPTSDGDPAVDGGSSSATADPAPDGEDGGEETGDATPVPTPTEEPLVSAPIPVGCDGLVTLEQFFEYNPNYALQPEPTAALNPDETTVSEAGGLVCQWQNLSSGDVVTLAVAALDADDLERFQNAAFENGAMVPTYDVEGYFVVTDGQGRATAFPPGYWVQASSATWIEPGDAQPVVAAMVANLG